MSRFGVCFIFMAGLCLNTANSHEPDKYSCDPSTVHSASRKMVVMDAGSSGVRIEAYCFEKTEDNEVIDLKFQTPLIESNNKLMPDSQLPPEFTRFLEQHQPVLHHLSPSRYFFFGATAGLRSLNNSDARKILLNSAHEIRNTGYVAEYNKNVRLLSGLEEGSYTWFGINFILQHTSPETSLVQRIKKMAKSHKSQFGIIELGGGSVQIAFRIPGYLKHFGLKRDTSPNLVRDQEANVKTFRLLDQYNLEVYANSLPRKGLNFAYHDLESEYSSNPAANPCLVKGTPLVDENHTAFHAYGNYDDCAEAINSTLFHPLQASFFKDNSANRNETIDPAYMKFLPDKFFLTGYFYDRTVSMGLPESLTPAYLEQAARHVCNMDYNTLFFADMVKSVFAGFHGTPSTSRLEKILLLKKKISYGGIPRKTNIRDYCTHLTYISQLLKKVGLSFDHRLYTQKSLLYRNKAYGVSWPLGYAILSANGWK